MPQRPLSPGEGGISVRRPAADRTVSQLAYWGPMGLNTRSSPRSPVTLAARWSRDDDHIEQCTEAVCPLGNCRSAVIARSTSGRCNLAEAEVTVGSSPPSIRAMWTT